MNITRIEDHGYRIGVPVPFPMKYIYCYLFRQEDHYVLIDVGLNYEPAKETWEAVFDELEIEPEQIQTIYLTHFHPDHSGLAGWMQNKTKADVFMHEIDMKMLDIVWGEGSSQSIDVKQMVLDHGTPEELSDGIRKHMDKLNGSVLPLPDVQPISAAVSFGNMIWEVIHTPGHSTGHICFYQTEKKILIAGDHILDKITPNISVWPRASQKPLHEYVSSLHLVKNLEVKKAYPAHGEPITNVKERIDELLKHHEERLEKIKNLANKRTAYDIASQLFAAKELNPHQWRFAMAETIAHLNYLHAEKKVEKEPSTPFVYQEVES